MNEFGVCLETYQEQPKNKMQEKVDQIVTKNKRNLDLTRFLYIIYSASRTRTYDIMINSHALLPTELWRMKAKQLPYLTGGNPQLLPAY